MTINQLDSFTPYVEIPEDEYNFLLNGTPPYSQHTDWFICGEPYSLIFDHCGNPIDIYIVCFASHGHYFKAERPVRSTCASRSTIRGASVPAESFDGVPSIEMEIAELRSVLNPSIFSDNLVLYKRGMDSDSELKNYRLYLSFIDKDGILVHGDVLTRSELIFDLCKTSFNGSFSYDVLDGHNPSDTKHLLDAVNSMSKYQYKTITIK